MNKTIKDLTELELKAMKSDIYESNAQNAQNIQIINQELIRRLELSTKITDKITDKATELPKKIKKPLSF